MNHEPVFEFLRSIQDTPGLREKINMLDLNTVAGSNTLLAMAAERGFRFTMEDWKSAQGELSDESFEQVARGTPEIKE